MFRDYTFEITTISPRGQCVNSMFDIGPWWRHDMETFSALLALCQGNPLVADGFPSQRTSNVELLFFFSVNLSKLLNKHSSCWQWDGTVLKWSQCHDFHARPNRVFKIMYFWDKLRNMSNIFMSANCVMCLSHVRLLTWFIPFQVV